MNNGASSVEIVDAQRAPSRKLYRNLPWSRPFTVALDQEATFLHCHESVYSQMNPSASVRGQ